MNVTSGGMGKFYISKTSGTTNPQTAAVSINGSVIEGEIYVIIVKTDDTATTDKRWLLQLLCQIFCFYMAVETDYT